MYSMNCTRNILKLSDTLACRWKNGSHLLVVLIFQIAHEVMCFIMTFYTYRSLYFAHIYFHYLPPPKPLLSAIPLPFTYSSLCFHATHIQNVSYVCDLHLHIYLNLDFIYKRKMWYFVFLPSKFSLLFSPLFLPQRPNSTHMSYSYMRENMQCLPFWVWPMWINKFIPSTTVPHHHTPWRYLNFSAHTAPEVIRRILIIDF